MLSVNRALFVWALGLLLSTLGCDRTVQSPAGQSPPAGKGESVGDSKQSQLESTSQAQQDQLPSGNSKLNLTAHESNATDKDTLPVANSELPEKPTAERIFTVEINKSDNPDRMVEYLTEIDRSIEQLLLSQKQMEKESVRENGLKLAKMKLAAAKHLSGLPLATPDHVKTGTKAQLVALSHLSGLKDVQAAKQLEELAKSLLNGADPELQQQGRVVLFGFAVQNLQNGVITDPQQIVLAAKTLVSDEKFRGRLEMTSLQHAMNALAQIGYHEQISQVQRISFDAFSSSADQPLRHEAWNRLVAGSPAHVEFLSSLEPLGSVAFNREAALIAAKKLITDFPNPVTLEMLASTVPNIEYSGQAEFSNELAKLIESELSKYSSTASTSTIGAVLGEHKLRMNWIGRPLDLLDVVDMDGKPINLAAEYQGKVILVSFGLTWDLHCMKEQPFIEQAYDELHAEGLEVLSISMDGDLQQLQKSVRENAKPWKTYRSATGDARPLTQHFGITMFPHMMLVGRDGKVASLHVRGKKIIDQAKLLLAK